MICPRCNQARHGKSELKSLRMQGGSAQMVNGRFVMSWGDDYF
jgi:hypothetical protein